MTKLMRIGWRQFIKSKFRSQSPYSAVGISLTVDTAYFCALKSSSHVNSIELYHQAPAGRWQHALESWVSDNNIGAAHCGVSFATQLHYSYQVEKPSVHPTEIHKALTWSVKEMAGSDAPELVFDYYDPPVQSSGADNLNVVALPKSSLDDVISGVMTAGLKLKSITVEDLAICDLIESDEAVMTILQRAGEEIQLTIVRGGKLYFSRSLKGFENLGAFSVEELQMGVMDSLTVQIQRSLDYYESQLRQAPIRTIFMNIESANSQVIANQIEELMQVEVCSFKSKISSKDMRLDSVDFNCLGAGYAALEGTTTITRQAT
jgi:MSHA biogenesis protein MshI